MTFAIEVHDCQPSARNPRRCRHCHEQMDPLGAFQARLKAWIMRRQALGQLSPEQAALVDDLFDALGVS